MSNNWKSFKNDENYFLFCLKSCFCSRDISIFGRLTLVDSILLNHSRTSVRLSVYPSLSFLKIGLLVFSDTVHDDNWPRYLVTEEARFLKRKKKIRGPNLDSTVLNHAQNEFFFHFPEFKWLVFLEIAYSHSLEQCLTSSRGKTHEENFDSPNLGRFLLNCVEWYLGKISSY